MSDFIINTSESSYSFKVNTESNDYLFNVNTVKNVYTFQINQGGSGGPVVWGGITGILSNQLDLQSALNQKQYKLVAGTNITIDTTNPVAPIISATGSVVIAPDATTTTKGVLRLSNDLGGTADTPTTPTAVHKAGDETITGLKTIMAQHYTTGLKVVIPTVNYDPLIDVPDAIAATVNGHTGPVGSLVAGMSVLMIGDKNAGLWALDGGTINSVGFIASFSASSTTNNAYRVLSGFDTVFNVNDKGALIAKSVAITGGTNQQVLLANGTIGSYQDPALKQDIANQLAVALPATVSPLWNGKTVFFTSTGLLTVPAVLPDQFNYNGACLLGVSQTWAITAPKVWYYGVPEVVIAGETYNFQQYFSSNNILVFK